MALTRDFREAIKSRVAYDAAFREALLVEGVELLFSGDVKTAKAILRDFFKPKPEGRHLS
ncbi:MAG: hypothetical protein WA463_04165 [Terriglobales bacterium]